MSVLVLQASYGGYDDMPVWPVQDVPHRRIVVTDGYGAIPVGDEALAAGQSVEVVIEHRPHMHPRLAAKVPKCLPWEYGNEDTIIWCDASVQPIDGEFIGWMIAHAGDAYLSAFAHPLRHRIEDEATASAWMEKYRGQDVHGQVKSYYDRGFSDVGLWASGLMVWRWAYEPPSQWFGRRWLAEQVRWTYQDQLSMGWAAWQAGVRFNVLPGSLFVPEPMHFLLRAHTRDD